MINNLYGGTYEVTLPQDYLHLLNCVCIYQLEKNWSCYDKGSYVQFGATRLTSDAWSQIINDYYNRPLPWRPYYYIHNINKSSTTTDAFDNSLPTNPYNPTSGSGTDFSFNNTKSVTIENQIQIKQEENLLDTNNLGIGEGSSTIVTEVPVNLAEYVKYENKKISLRDSEKVGGIRYGNASETRMEIRIGKDRSVFTLLGVQVDYLKAPQRIRLTQEQVDMITDTSQMMEFPDYVCQEIINELVHIIMVNTGDPQLQNHIPSSTSIAQPAQQQAAPAAQQTQAAG